jgi:ABC-2 type transport system permease protein
MFWIVQQSLLFPLLILSGMMLPIEQGPPWMQVLSRFNPLTYVVDAERTLLSGQLGSAVTWGWCAAVATCAAGLWLGIRQIQRSTT